MGLGLVHACVDATTVTVVFRAANAHELTTSHAFALVLGYDLLAFGSQVVLGVGADRWKAQGAATRLGLLLSAVSVACITSQPVVAMLLAALGNALFHMGAGGLILGRDRRRSAPSGIFVAPGALGLAFGLTYGKLPDLGPAWPLALLLGVGLLATWRWTSRANLDMRPANTGHLLDPAQAQPRLGTWPWLILSLLLLSVAVRSLVGFSAARGIPSNAWLFFGIPCGAFAGKAIGGLIADRYGWIETSLLALVASAPCIVLGFKHTLVLLCGICLFQMTMPVTLAAVARLMPDRLSTAFGWTCVALVVGALPSMFALTKALCTRPMLAVWIGLACVSVTLGLRLLGIELRLRKSWRIVD
jgi:FSR family fosmidomycin resistance protein-like MFS transporter